MQRIQTADERFAAGNPQLGTPGTIVTAKFLNDVQEEISNVIIESGLVLDGTKENQLSEAIQKFISDKTMLTFDSIPMSKINDIIYVLRKGILEWQTFGSWQGYARLDIGTYIPDGTQVPRSFTIDATGDTFSKTAYPALWAWAQADGRVVSSGAWAKNQFNFVDMGSVFRVPDMRNTVVRATGTDLDNANARLLGSAQQDALQNISGSLTDIYGGPSFTKSGAFSKTSVWLDGKWGDPSSGGQSRTVWEVKLNAADIARTSSETRGTNTALAPRIIAF